MSSPVVCNHDTQRKSRLQLIGTLSGGQKSRVAFAALSLQNPHVLLLDEVRTIVLASDNRLTLLSPLTTSTLKYVDKLPVCILSY